MAFLKSLHSVYGAALLQLIGVGYWIQGFRCFPWFAVNFYFTDVLRVNPGTLQIVQSTVNIPMVAKPIYGAVSDAVYIKGGHRVPYVVIGAFIQAVSWSTITLLSTGGASALAIGFLLTLSNMGASICEVANDAIVAECSKKKKSSGELQSFAWFSSAGGGVLGNLLAIFALMFMDFRTIFGVFGILVVFQVWRFMGVDETSLGIGSAYGSSKKKYISTADLSPHSMKRTTKVASGHANSSDSVYTFRNDNGLIYDKRTDDVSTNLLKDEGMEEDLVKTTTMKQQFADLIHLMKQPEIFYPLSWVVTSYAVIPTMAGTMFFFQTQHLKINSSVIALSKVLGQVGLMAGSALYNRHLKGLSLRTLLGSVQILLCFCTMFDILLVKRVNVWLGIPDCMMVLGASAFIDALNQFKILPFLVLLAQVCTPGSEGSLMAAFMSIQCLATIISGYMGVLLASVLGISSNNFTWLPTGIFVQSIAATIPLLWISFIPKGNIGSMESRDGKKT